MARRKSFGGTPAQHAIRSAQDVLRGAKVGKRARMHMRRNECRLAADYLVTAAILAGRTETHAEESLPPSGRVEGPSRKAILRAGRLRSGIRKLTSDFKDRCVRPK